MSQRTSSRVMVATAVLIVGTWVVACTPTERDQPSAANSEPSSQSRASARASTPERRGSADDNRGLGIHADTTCVVSRIIDGDSFECAGRLRVRLIGIDAPENSQGSDGAKAKAALTELMPLRQPVRLQFDRKRADGYGRLLAYGWTGDAMVNEALVAGGWTLAGDFPPNVMYSRRLRAAEERARERKAGLWATGGFSCRPAERRAGRC